MCLNLLFCRIYYIHDFCTCICWLQKKINSNQIILAHIILAAILNLCKLGVNRWLNVTYYHIIVFNDPENMGINTKIRSLYVLEPNIQAPIILAAILNSCKLGTNTNLDVFTDLIRHKLSKCWSLNLKIGLISSFKSLHVYKSKILRQMCIQNGGHFEFMQIRSEPMTQMPYIITPLFSLKLKTWVKTPKSGL